MRRLLLLIGYLTAMTLLLHTLAAQEQPVVPAPRAPIEQWPQATPWAPPANNSNANQAGATTPPQPNVNTSITSAPTLATDNLGGIDPAYFLTGQENLAEAARDARERLAKDRPRMFTNDDIARLRHAAGEPPLGISPGGKPVTNEQTMPASDVTTPNPARPNSGNPNNASNATPDNSTQNNVPASDQTAPPAPNNQPPAKRSPFRPKQ